MNGIEKITARIEADASEQIARVLDAAKAEAAQISAKYQSLSDSERAELRAKNERAAAEREERLVSAAHMDARKVQLAAKQEMLDAAYDLALEKLCAMEPSKYEAVLAALLEKASAGETGEVVFSEKDAAVGKAAIEKVNKAAGKKLVLSAQNAPIRGGFILKDKNVEVNCTFETLVRLEKANTAGEVAKLLFS
ncbi:MAG: hypothetical protein IJF15_02085 [Oscillospiraceae bacterium]|nr:hypothetical protein [Oscillospiraceae bacterium]